MTCHLPARDQLLQLPQRSFLCSQRSIQRVLLTTLTTLTTLVTAALLSACGGGGGGTAAAAPADVIRTLGCAPNQSVALASGGRLVNNTWNVAAVGNFAWSQCLLEKRSGSDVQYGWNWRWPDNGNQVYAYPEINIGAKPWESGPGNDARFPRSLASTPRLLLDFDVDSSGTGSRNLAASFWFIRTPTVASPPVESDIVAELMVWADYTPDMVSNDGPATLRGEVTVDGRAWMVYAAEDWGAGAVTTQRWRFIVYLAKERTQKLNFDARKLMADAVARGLLPGDAFIANVELGNELVSGSGTTFVRSFTVTTP